MPSDAHSIARRNRNNDAIGLCSVCSAHPLVLEAALAFDRESERAVLIEATCNQVNQDGGYTGMTPADFRVFVDHIAERVGFDRRRLLLGGDHLGPNPWQHRPAVDAMARADELVAAYAAAGFTKLHLDASMPLADDRLPLVAERVAERAARLCAVAEQHAPDPDALSYVIGTEVPVPGGETDGLSQIAVTRAERVEQTVETHRTAFAALGLENAFARVFAIVVQPGVDFDHSSIIAYEPAAARELVAALDPYQRLVFEAHSTDYQPAAVLRALVDDHFAILKVGPALTFALREGIFALAAIENELIGADQRSDIRAVLERVMRDNPSAWQNYYQREAGENRVLRAFSYSDRIRYYWACADVRRALDVLFDNLNIANVPPALWQQYAGVEYARLGARAVTPEAVVIDKIQQVLADYRHACLSRGE